AEIDDDVEHAVHSLRRACGQGWPSGYKGHLLCLWDKAERVSPVTQTRDIECRLAVRRVRSAPASGRSPGAENGGDGALDHVLLDHLRVPSRRLAPGQRERRPCSNGKDLLTTHGPPPLGSSARHNLAKGDVHRARGGVLKPRSDLLP